MEEQELRDKAKLAGVKNWHTKSIKTLEKELKPVRKRKGGVPLGVHHSKLSVPDGLIPSDRVGRWVNDKDNRITLALGSDWEFVVSTEGVHIGDGFENKNSDIGAKISQIVGQNGQGEPMRAYLMMKWRDWHEEDQAKKAERDDELEAAIRKPGYGAKEKGVDTDGISGKMKYKA